MHWVTMAAQISLQELLSLQGQPVTEEQAWALCYHGCHAIQQQQSQASNWTGWLMNWRQPQFHIADDLILNEDGTVVCVSAGTDGKKNTCTEGKVIESLGVLIYKALDWSLSDDEERVLSLPLEHLIQQMVLRSEDQPPVTIDEIIKMCRNHLQDPSAVSDFRAVNKALFAETMELRRNLNSIRSAKKTLKRLLEEDFFDKARSESACWSRAWFQLMKEVRSGIRLRSTSERSCMPLPVKPEQSSFKKILDDIKYKRYILHHVTLNNNEPRTPCKALLDFGLLRSLLKPVTERKLRDLPSSSPCLHEMLMREIQSGVKKLKPVSSDGKNQSMNNSGSSVQTGLGLQCQDIPTDHRARGWHQQMNRCMKPEFLDLESEADCSGFEQNIGRGGQSLDAVHNRADMSTERVSPKPSSWLDVTKLVKHSNIKYKFQYPLQIGKPLGAGYEFVENEEFHYSSTLYIKELACVCQTIIKREVRNRKMVKDKELAAFQSGLGREMVRVCDIVATQLQFDAFAEDGSLYTMNTFGEMGFCFFCQRELFFTWTLTCHFCKTITLFRVLYEDVNPLPCMHLPIICKPLAVRTVDAGVQAERCRCGWEKVQQWDSSNWKPKGEDQELAHVVEHC